jgi:hypothetical protein
MFGKHHLTTAAGRSLHHHTRVITDIRTYVEKVSKKKQLLQYLERRHIAQKLEGYRSSLWEEYVVFDVKSLFKVYLPTSFDRRLQLGSIFRRPSEKQNWHGRQTSLKRKKCSSNLLMNSGQLQRVFSISRMNLGFPDGNRLRRIYFKSWRSDSSS